MGIAPHLLNNLVCPRDGGELSVSGSSLLCAAGHRFPVVEDVPVFLLDDVPQCLWVAEASINESQAGRQADAADPYYLDTVGISDEERSQLREDLKDPNRRGVVDPVVGYLVAATNGRAYKHLIGNLPDYPIPELRLPPGNGRVLLDVGCNWGRWCIAAARLGYKPIGIDPSLGAVMAARRVAKQMGLQIDFVVGDARYLPFRQSCIDTVFSYSVLQHFSRDSVALAVGEIGRVLRAGGNCLVQMPNTFGIRCLYHQIRRGFSDGSGFDVRFWTPSALRRLFADRVGPTTFSVDCFFGLGLQATDLRLMPLSHKALIQSSELLRAMSRVVPGMVYTADSVYVQSVRAALTGRAAEHASSSPKADRVS